MKYVNQLFIGLTAFSAISCQTVIVPHEEVRNTLTQNLKIGETAKSSDQEMTIPKTLTIQKAKDLSLIGNPTLKAAGERIKRAQAVIQQAQALYYPTITATSGATRQDLVPEGRNGFDTQSFESYNAHLSSKWLIFDGFARKYQVLAAQYGEISSEAAFDDTKRLLVDAVAQAFYETILATKQIEINLELKEINEEFLKDTKVKEEAGTATKTEVNNFIVNRNDSQIAYLDAKNSFETAKLVLIELLGLPEADTEAFETIYKDLEISVPKYKTALGIALNKRPDLKVLQAQILAAEAQIKEAEGEYYPEIFLEGSYGATSFDTAGFGDNDRDSYYGMGMTWNLFTGNSTSALIAQRTAEKEEQLHKLKSQWQNVISEIRQQRKSLLNSIERVKVQKESAELSKSIYEDTKQIYENGATTITRVNEVLTDYSIARLSQVLFEVEALRRKELLDALMGTNIN
ncbi:MAG: TolC family protein [Lentisphaerales bacterium]|nr:TolC family protein [Lentisphaerales bacterium]